MTYTDMEALYMIRKGDMDAKRALDRRFFKLVWKLANECLWRYQISYSHIHDARQAALLGYERSLREYDASRETGLAHFVKVAVFDYTRSALRNHISRNGVMNERVVSLDKPVSESSQNEYHDIVRHESRAYCPQTYGYVQDADERVSYEFKNRFSELERKIFVMRMKGFAYQEIANQHNVSSKQVDNILRKVMRNTEQHKSVLFDS